MSLGTTVIAIGTVLTSLATLLVFMRCICRFRLLRTSSADDYLILLSITLSWVLIAFLIAQIPYGLGRHLAEVQLEDLGMISKLSWICQIIYNTALTTMKLSAVLQILRFSIERRSRAIGWILFAIISAYGTAVVITCIFSCSPISFYWDKSIRGGTCINTLPWGTTNITLNVATDLAVVALPLHVLKKLSLSRRDRLAIQGTFVVGGLTCFTSILRLYFIIISSENMDFTYNAAHIGLWSAIELNIGIACTCVPTIRPLLLRFMSRRFTKSALSTDQTSSSDTTLVGTFRSKFSCRAQPGNEGSSNSNSTMLSTIRSKVNHGTHPSDDEDTLIDRPRAEQ